MSSDDDDHFGDPLPDPALRHWRHPSELRGLDGPEDPAPALRSNGMLPLMAIGTFAVGGVGVMLVALSISGVALFGQGRLTVPDPELPGLPTSRSEPEVGASTATSTTVLAAPADTLEEPSVESFTLGSEAPEPLPDDGGVFALPGSSARLASFLVYDDLVMTSAGALDGRRAVWLDVGDDRVNATVVGADAYTDVAVLEVEQWPALFDQMDLAQYGAGDPVRAEQVSILAPVPGFEAADSWQGMVGSTDDPITTALLRQCYDAFVTTLTDPVPAGSAVLADSGEVVGMVIAAESSLVAAVPLTTAVAVGTSMMTSGSPTATWLGIKVTTDDEGETRLVSVVDDGPADGVLEPEDVIESLNGEDVASSDHLVHLVRQAGVNTQLDLVVDRGGDQLSLQIVTGRQPPAPAG